MARALRIEFPGAFYHVISRGNARQMVFREDRDFARFVDLLAEACARFGWHCHCYCLMGNHYHLLLETADANLSVGMRWFNGGYTQWYNRRHQRVGHLYQGRYKALLVQHDKHLLELARYIVLNPVRAGMVARPHDWVWSSYAWLAGRRVAPRWAKPDQIWSALAADPRVAARRFVDLVAEGGSERVPGWSRNGVLGDDDFKRNLKFLLERQRERTEHPVEARWADRPPLASLFPTEESAALRDDLHGQIVRAVLTWRYDQAEVARFVGLSQPTVSRIVRRGKASIETPPESGQASENE